MGYRGIEDLYEEEEVPSVEPRGIEHLYEESVEPPIEEPPRGIEHLYDDIGDKSTTRLALMPTKSADTINDLMDDDNFNVVNQYMDQRFGMREGKDHNRQEVVDSFVNHMRKFSFGQSITTVSELAYLNKAKSLVVQLKRRLS